jgi:hypothetical protein
VTIDGAQINRPARPAGWAEHIEPRRPGDQRGSDRWRPQHVAGVARRRFQRSMTSSASRRAALSAFSFAAPAFDVEPSCPDAHGGQYRGAAGEVDLTFGLGEHQAHPLGVSPHGHTM